MEPPLGSAAALAFSVRTAVCAATIPARAPTRPLAAADRPDLRSSGGDGCVRRPGIVVAPKLADAAVVRADTRCTRRALARPRRLCKSQGDDMGVVVYDITHNHYYSYNDSTPFLLASSAKVPIMLSYLDLVESQNRQPSTSETQLLTRMITVSDNDAAQALFQARGWNAGQAQYLQKIGVSGYQPNANGWGWATLPPSSMAQLFTMLYQGKVLNEQIARWR